jgi:sugar lactone lactonase YvrE
VTVTSTLLDSGLLFPESPRWHDGALWLSDMHRRAVLRVDGTGVPPRVVTEVPNEPSGLGWLPDGTLLIASMLDRRLVAFSGGALVPHSDLSGLVTGVCNDMVVDERGRAYVGGINAPNPRAAMPGNLIFVDEAGKASVASDDLVGPNGIVLTPDGKTLIAAETGRGRLTAWDRNPDGSLDRRRVWADCGDSAPDGICLDAEGAVWLADVRGSQLVRVLEGGHVTDRIPVRHGRAFACTLGGRGGRTLLACTGTRSYALRDGPGTGTIEYAVVTVPHAGRP